jgi:hypothetical protein
MKRNGKNFDRKSLEKNCEKLIESFGQKIKRRLFKMGAEKKKGEMR